MGERLLIAAALIVAGALVYVAGAWLQRRRATRSFRTEREAGARPEAVPGRPRVLYFRSDTCASCATQSQLLQQLDAHTLQLIEKIDVDRERERAQAYNILTLPTTLVVDADGEVKHINYGVVSPAKLRRQVAAA